MLLGDEKYWYLFFKLKNSFLLILCFSILVINFIRYDIFKGINFDVGYLKIKRNKGIYRKIIFYGSRVILDFCFYNFIYKVWYLVNRGIIFS